MEHIPPPQPTHHIAKAMAKVRTKQDLTDLFRKLGLRASRKLGQNFLVDHNLLEFIVRTGDVGENDLVLDIGCGTGLLTAHLAEAAGKVIGVELDRRMHTIASHYVGGLPNVELLRMDALARKRRMAPELMETVRREWDTGKYGALRVVSNLPYSVASLIVPNLLESDLPLAVIVAMVQREVADRMVAETNTPAYGSLSLVVRVHTKAAYVRTVSPSVFWPRPKVESAIVKLTPRDQHISQIADYDTFLEVIRAGFTHRRKKLVNPLLSAKRFGDAETVKAALATSGIQDGARAQHVSLDQYIQLANLLHTE